MGRAKKCVLVVLLAAVALLFGSIGQAGAAPIPLFSGSTRTGSEVVGAGRWIYFELLNDVTVTQLGVVLDPSSSSDRFRWDLFSTDSCCGTFNTLVFDTTVTYPDVGLTTYDTDVSIMITTGFYALGLTTLDAAWIIGLVNDASGARLNPTIDGNFRVFGSAASQPDNFPPTVGNNTFAPQFSVNVLGFEPPPSPAPIPEPSTLLLFGSGLVGMGGMARRRKQK